MPTRLQPLLAPAVARAQMTNARRLTLVGVAAACTLGMQLLGVPVASSAYVAFAIWLALGLWAGRVIQRARRSRDADRSQTFAFLGDTVLLTVACASIGGGWWMALTLGAFIVTFAFATLPRPRGSYVAVFALFCFFALIGLQASGVVTELPFAGATALRGHYGLAAAVALFGGTMLITFGAIQNTFIKIMRRAQERSRVLLQTAPDIILSVDRQGLIVSANEAARIFAASARVMSSGPEPVGKFASDPHRTSLSGAAVVGVHVAMFAHPDDRELFAADVDAAATGESRQRELRMGGDAESYWYLVTCNAIREEERVTGVLVVARDITVRKQDEEALRRSEEQLRQAQKMEAIGRLAGGVAHDFNNLLTVIGTYSELLLRGISEGTARREDVEEIYKATIKGSALTNQLLTFSRKQVLQLRLINLNDTVAGMETMVRRLIDPAIRIETRTYPNLAATRADPAQLEQVLLNLAVNARDAMPTGGLLRIETDDVYLDAEYAAAHAGVQPGRYVLLSVSDTGQGMDEDTRARIFEPFFTTKRAGEGTGLGLATVYGIVQQSGGHIDVESELGAGCTFRLYFPVSGAREGGDGASAPVSAAHSDAAGSRASQPHAQPPIRAAEYGGSETILLVEDGKALRDVLQRILEDLGYTVFVAKDGDEALVVAGRVRDPIHLLVTDVVMPQMGGRELAVELWQRRPETRVLFMSGYTEDSILQQGLRKPSVGFIGKPFRPEALARKVRQMLDASPVTSDADRAPARVL